MWRLRKPNEVRVDLSETPESKALKRAEEDWPRVHAFARENRELRERNEFGERFAAAFRLAEQEDEQE